MTIQAPTRITIEVHHPGTEAGDGMSVVRVIPELATANRPAMAAQREEAPAPAAFEPGECRCLDDDDCLADHANDD